MSVAFMNFGFSLTGQEFSLPSALISSGLFALLLAIFLHPLLLIWYFAIVIGVFFTNIYELRLKVFRFKSLCIVFIQTAKVFFVSYILYFLIFIFLGFAENLIRSVK